MNRLVRDAVSERRRIRARSERLDLEVVCDHATRAFQNREAELHASSLLSSGFTELSATFCPTSTRIEKDNAALAQAFDTVASHPPSGFSGWDTIAKKGAEAARAGNLDDVKASCKSCHDDLRPRFKKEIRDKPLF
jgi:hypothetical protein